MKVLFDVTSLLGKRLTSEGVYTKHLFRLLKGLGTDVTPMYTKPVGFSENHIESHLGVSAKKFYSLFQSKGAILHGPSGNFLSESDKFIKVISINDLAMFRDGFYPKDLEDRLQVHLKQQLQQDVRAIIVPSQEVHNEVLIRFPKYVGKVHVVTPGSDHILESSRISGQPIVSSPYFLFVGTLDKRSNVVGVIKAFAAFCEMQSGTQLVLVGDQGLGFEAVKKAIDSCGHGEKISIVGYKSEGQLKKIYGDALGLIIPSYYEGFSYPLVEAMKLGCPVLTSAIGAMKEVGGEAAHLVNPKDVEQIMAGMERIYADRVYKDKLVQLGQQVTAKMTWLACAREIVEIYREVLKS